MAATLLSGCFEESPTVPAEGGTTSVPDPTTGAESTDGGSSDSSSSNGSTSTGEPSTGSSGECFEDLLHNGDFEDWPAEFVLPPPWELLQGQDIAESSDTPYGTAALQISGTETPVEDGEPLPAWDIKQDVLADFAPFEVLVFSAEVKYVSGDLDNPQVVVNGGGYPSATLPFVGTGDWETVQANLEIWEEGATMLSIFFKSTAAAQTVLIDDVHLWRPCP